MFDKTALSSNDFDRCVTALYGAKELRLDLPPTLLSKSIFSLIANKGICQLMLHTGDSDDYSLETTDEDIIEFLLQHEIGGKWTSLNMSAEVSPNFVMKLLQVKIASSKILTAIKVL